MISLASTGLGAAIRNHEDDKASLYARYYIVVKAPLS